MADEENEVIQTVVNDLIKRVSKLESNDNNLINIENYLKTLDGVSFNMTVVLGILNKLVVEKELITKDELEKRINDERNNIIKQIEESKKES